MTTTALWAAFPKIGISRSEMEERATVAVVLRTRVRAAIRTRNGRLWTNFPPVLLEADQARLVRRPVRGGSADSGKSRSIAESRKCEKHLSRLPWRAVHGCNAYRCVAVSVADGPVVKNAFCCVDCALSCRSGSREVYAKAVRCQCRMSPYFRQMRTVVGALHGHEERARKNPAVRYK